jgi:hypothetical protein
MTDFNKIALNEFDFLVSDFGYALEKSSRQEWGYEIVYLSKNTGVKIIYEVREAYIHINLYQLIDGRLIDNPLIIKSTSILHGYSLDDILLIRSPSSIIKPAYFYGNKYNGSGDALKLYISAFAKNLKKNALDVLLGDFTIFEKVNKTVKDRARQND